MEVPGGGNRDRAYIQQERHGLHLRNLLRIGSVSPGSPSLNGECFGPGPPAEVRGSQVLLVHSIAGEGDMSSAGERILGESLIWSDSHHTDRWQSGSDR